MEKGQDSNISHDNILWWLFRILSEESDVPLSTKEMIDEYFEEEEKNGRDNSSIP